MTETIRSVQGTEDVLPDRWGWWRKLCGHARRLFELYGYGEVRTPLLEHGSLFVKGTGATTDIVQKQMFALQGGDDDDAETVTLRPEGTPPTIRTYLENQFHKKTTFQKFYYIGPMFRKERPQKGRLRQFHQAGVEAVGGASPLLDVETVALARDIYRAAGLQEFEITLNSIGCEQCRTEFRREVHDRLEPRREELCEDCRDRMDRNVFRVLDCKNENCRRMTAELPPMTDFLCEGCAAHHGRVKELLADLSMDYVEDPHLVRGLDYYTRTVYEITHPGLGARDTICGGGRYDGLVELLGGPSLPCVGFAMGLEASILAMEAELGEPPSTALEPVVYVVSFEDHARPESFRLVQALRRAGIAAEMDFEQRSAKAQMRMADGMNARLCFLMGERELQNDRVLIKEMKSGDQWNVPRADAVDSVQEYLRKHDRNDQDSPEG